MCAVMSRLYVGSFRNIVHPNEGIPPNRTLPTRADYGRLAFFYFDDHFWNRTADHGGGSNPQSSAEYESFTIFANCLILFQNIIPIAIFISVDVAKIFYQSYMIRVDEEMYDAETEQYALPRSWNLCDDLGQIEYVFSDKTGTLTSNDMVFRKCTINGVVYGDSYISEALVGARIKAASSAAREKDLLDQKLLDRAQEEICMRETMDSLFNTQFVSKNGMLPFVDSTLHKHVVEGLDVVNNTKDNDEAGAEVDYSDYSIPGSKIANQSTAIIEFFTLLAVCHTVLLDDPVSEDCPSPSIKYKAQSPDEAALVSAAKDVGFTFLKREDNRVTVDILGTQKVFYILHVLEFNSDRKRMSVIVRKEGDEQVVLLCKGADTVVFERLHSNNDASLLRMTEQHLETFANDGLRTLCLAYKIISDSEYIPWAKQYKEVQLLVDNREEELDRLASGIENGFSLMGATAIEDKLQEGVPESIETLAKAGIKLWVLTV